MPQTKQNGHETYTDFLGSLQLFAIALVESRCSVDHDSMFERPDPVEVTFESTYEVADIGDDYFEVRTSLTVIGEYSKRKGKVLTIHADYNLHLHAKPPISPDFVRRFTNSEARLLAWPYFREFVASTCGRMCIPPIVLPLSNRAVNSGGPRRTGRPANNISRKLR